MQSAGKKGNDFTAEPESLCGIGRRPQIMIRKMTKYFVSMKKSGQFTKEFNKNYLTSQSCDDALKLPKKQKTNKPSYTVISYNLFLWHSSQ